MLLPVGMRQLVFGTNSSGIDSVPGDPHPAPYPDNPPVQRHGSHGLRGAGRGGGKAASEPPHAQTTNSGTSSWVRSKEKYLLVLFTGKVSWMLMHCWARQPLQ